MTLHQAKAVKHQCCNIKSVLNDKNETKEEDNGESDSNNEFISNDYIALINVHIFLGVGHIYQKRFW